MNNCMRLMAGFGSLRSSVVHVKRIVSEGKQFISIIFPIRHASVYAAE